MSDLSVSLCEPRDGNVDASRLPAITVDDFPPPIITGDVIDYSPILGLIRARLGWGRSATDKAEQLLIQWHRVGRRYLGGKPVSEVVTLVDEGRCQASACVALTGRGDWLVGYSMSHPISATLSGPCVWARCGYRTRDAAVDAVRGMAEQFFRDTTARRNSCVSAGLERQAQRIAERLRGLLVLPVHSGIPKADIAVPAALPAHGIQPVQLTLF